MLEEQTTDPPLDDLQAVATREDVLAAIDAARRRLRRGERQPLRRRAPAAHARELAARARRQPAVGHRAPPHREGARRRPRPRLRAPRGRSERRGRGPRAPADPRAGGTDGGRRRGGRGSPGARRDTGSRVMRRGGALVLGGVVLAAAIVFASRPLGVAGLGLLLAALVARLWVAARGQPRRHPDDDRAGSGDGRRRGHAADRGAQRVAPRLSALPSSSERSRASETYECRLRSHDGRLTGELPLGALPRGRFESDDAQIELRDPLGLEVRSRPLGIAVSALVQPRLVELRTLFDDSGQAAR